MRDPRDSDKDYYIDINGDPRPLPGVKKSEWLPPVKEKQTKEGFTYYEGGEGCCALCGRYDCSGRCFK